MSLFNEFRGYRIYRDVINREQRLNGAGYLYKLVSLRIYTDVIARHYSHVRNSVVSSRTGLL